MRKFILLFLTFSLSSTVVAIADEAITLVGEGARTCQRFLDDFDDDPSLAEDVYFAWSQGYLVGLNSRSDLFYDLRPGNLNAEAQSAFLMQYCQKAPKVDFIEAVRKLYQQIVMENIALGN
ncbi:MAG: hypothetical protein ACE5EM_06240 [Sphingomonadales bacterium]